jgi:hypothetical protein
MGRRAATGHPPRWAEPAAPRTPPMFASMCGAHPHTRLSASELVRTYMRERHITMYQKSSRFKSGEAYYHVPEAREPVRKEAKQAKGGDETRHARVEVGDVREKAEGACDLCEGRED